MVFKDVASSSSAYGRGPECSSPAQVGNFIVNGLISANKVVHYTGAKLIGYADNGCTRGDYAQIVLQASMQTQACRMFRSARSLLSQVCLSLADWRFLRALLGSG